MTKEVPQNILSPGKGRPGPGWQAGIMLPASLCKVSCEGHTHTCANTDTNAHPDNALPDTDTNTDTCSHLHAHTDICINTDMHTHRDRHILAHTGMHRHIDAQLLTHTGMHHTQTYTCLHTEARPVFRLLVVQSRSAYTF